MVLDVRAEEEKRRKSRSNAGQVNQSQTSTPESSVYSTGPISRVAARRQNIDRQSKLASERAIADKYKMEARSRIGRTGNNRTQQSVQPTAKLGLTSALGDAAVSTYQPPRQDMSKADKDAIAGRMEGLGMNLKFPIVSKPSNGVSHDPKNYPSVYAAKQAPAEEPIAETYNEKQQPQANIAPAKLGFDPVKNPQSVQNNTTNFRMPTAPMRGYDERIEREALLRDASTAYKGAQNGQLTASQMQLRAGIVGADDKYKNDQYQAQLSAASQLAQAQMSQDGANQRAVLGETGTNNRMNTQLGFDAAKFQQTAQMEQQRLGDDTRRLDMAQENQDVQNYAPKQLNALYAKFDAAQSDEDRSAIAKEIQSLKGNADKKSAPVVITQTGESPIPGGLGGVSKNPSIIYNPDDATFTNLPTAKRTLNDPIALKMANDDNFTREERQAAIQNYMDTGVTLYDGQ